MLPHNLMTPMCKFGGLSTFWNTDQNGVQRYLELFVINLRQAILNDLSFFYIQFLFFLTYITSFIFKRKRYSLIERHFDAYKGDFPTRVLDRARTISLCTVYIQFVEMYESAKRNLIFNFRPWIHQSVPLIINCGYFFLEALYLGRFHFHYDGKAPRTFINAQLSVLSLRNWKELI